MRVLLDTHTFLWWVTDSQMLSSQARAIIEDGSNEVFFSVASAWELAIKTQLGKLQLAEPLETLIPSLIESNAFTLLPIQLEHTLRLANLPLHHRDPFDRMLIAQSQIEDLALLSADPQIQLYSAKIVW